MKDKINKFVVYGIVDPLNGQLRYVGKTNNFKNRKVKHLQSGKNNQKNPTSCTNWINSLRKKELKPEFIIIDEFSSNEETLEMEIFYIAYYKSIGCKLLNHTLGGEGVTGLYHSLERRIRNSQIQGGKSFIDQNGNKYYSPMQAERLLGVTKSKIRNILKKKELKGSGYTFEYIDENTNIEELKNKLQLIVENDKANRRILCSDGLLFKGVNECARYYNISHGRITSLCQGKTIKTNKNLSFAYFYPSKENYEEKLKELKEKIEFKLTYSYIKNGKFHKVTPPFKDKNGIVYNSIKEASEKTNIAKTTIIKHLNKVGKNSNNFKFFFI